MTGLLYFLPLSLVIAVVLSALKKDELSDILMQAGKLFAVLVAGTVAFSLLLYLCSGSPFFLFAFFGLIVAVLAFFTLKGMVDWARGPKEGGKNEEAPAS